MPAHERVYVLHVYSIFLMLPFELMKETQYVDERIFFIYHEYLYYLIYVRVNVYTVSTYNPYVK